MINAIADKFILVIFGFIESDHTCHVEMLENLKIVLGRVASSLEFTNIVEWAHKRNKFVRYDPVQVTVLDLLIILVLLVVKFPELVPAEANCILETLQAVQDRARVTALEGVRGITEWLKLIVIWFKELPGGLSLDLQDDNHESAHEKRTVCHLIIFVAAIMEKPVIFILRIGEETHELPDKLVNHG